MENYNDIYETITDCIENIFLKYQKEYEIKGGGLPSEMYLDIDDNAEKLTELIANGLLWQIENNH